MIGNDTKLSFASGPRFSPQALKPTYFGRHGLCRRVLAMAVHGFFPYSGTTSMLLLSDKRPEFGLR